MCKKSIFVSDFSFRDSGLSGSKMQDPHFETLVTFMTSESLLCVINFTLQGHTVTKLRCLRWVLCLVSSSQPPHFGSVLPADSKPWTFYKGEVQGENSLFWGLLLSQGPVCVGCTQEADKLHLMIFTWQKVAQGMLFHKNPFQPAYQISWIFPNSL